MKSVIEGIVLEGVDYIGKTTIARALKSALQQDGANIQHNKCFIEECDLIRFLLDKAKLDDTLIGRDWFYTTCCLIDLNRPINCEGFLIQERHWFSQVVRNEFFYQDEFKRYTQEILDKRVQFSKQIYLTSDMSTKRERASYRAPKSPRDLLLYENASYHQEFDEFSISRLPKSEKWQIIDTSNKTVDQIVHEIL